MGMQSGAPGQPAQMTSSMPWAPTRPSPGIPGQIAQQGPPPPGGMYGAAQQAMPNLPYMGTPQIGNVAQMMGAPQPSYGGAAGNVPNMQGQLPHAYQLPTPSHGAPMQVPGGQTDPRLSPGWNMRMLHPALQQALLPGLSGSATPGTTQPIYPTNS